LAAIAASEKPACSWAEKPVQRQLSSLTRIRRPNYVHKEHIQPLVMVLEFLSEQIVKLRRRVGAICRPP
jgi:hypothetical protein